MRELEKYRPTLATVLDLETEGQYDEVMSWAEQASQFCEYPVVIPKVEGITRRIPRKINGKVIVLGYSVPTGHGSTPVSPQEFHGRWVHLLGGSPHRQMILYGEMRTCCDIFSADGNYAQRMAVRHNRFWANGDATYAGNRWWPRLDEADSSRWVSDAPYEAFRRSCQNIMRAWSGLASASPRSA